MYCQTWDLNLFSQNLSLIIYYCYIPSLDPSIYKVYLRTRDAYTSSKRNIVRWIPKSFILFEILSQLQGMNVVILLWITSIVLDIFKRSPTNRESYIDAPNDVLNRSKGRLYKIWANENLLDDVEQTHQNWIGIVKLDEQIWIC